MLNISETADNNVLGWSRRTSGTPSGGTGPSSGNQGKWWVPLKDKAYRDN